MAAAEKSLSTFADLVAPSSNASALVFDPDEAAAENRTRLVKVTAIAQRGVYLTTGDPNGVITAPGPGIAVDSLGGLWSRPVATPGNTGWIKLIS